MNSKNVVSEGALYELLSRGNKDLYFFADEASAVYPYDNRYVPQPPTISEIRILPPTQVQEFGRPLEFEFEIAGDSIIDPTFLIQLPSWIPQPYDALNTKSVITDTAGISYGYVKGIAYFLFEKIQFFQDRLLLQEWSGDGLYAISRSRGSLNSVFLDNELTGKHNGSALEIGRNATPGLLRLSLPLPGSEVVRDCGFPRLLAPQQTYRIRCILRKLEDLVEASDGREKPKPWGRTDFQIRTSVGQTSPTQFSTVNRDLMAKPTIRLETRHVYMDRDTQEGLKKESKKESVTLPFERIYENNFVQSPIDYAPLQRNGVATITRRLDGEHPVARIVMGFRTQQTLRKNQYYNFTADISGGQFYTGMSFYVAGRDRETTWDSLVWKDIVQHAKEERDSGEDLAFINWTLGDVKGHEFNEPRQIEGSVNFTTADRPTLQITLANIPIDPVLNGVNTRLDVWVDSWASMIFENERGALLFGN
jgi:hypothetical protein